MCRLEQAAIWGLLSWIGKGSKLSVGHLTLTPCLAGLTVDPIHVALPRPWLPQMVAWYPCSVVPDSRSCCFRLQQNLSAEDTHQVKSLRGSWVLPFQNRFVLVPGVCFQLLRSPLQSLHAGEFSGHPLSPLSGRTEREREQHTVREGAQSWGRGKLWPASHHCRIPACWFFPFSSTGWEPSLPLEAW